MALNSSAMKAKFKSRIFSGLQRVFQAEVDAAPGYAPIAAASWEKIADAVSDIAMDIVSEMQTNAEVTPGQAVTGTFIGTGSGPVTGTTTSPGHIT